MNKFLNIALVSAFALCATGCEDYLDTNSPSISDREFVFSSEESARGALNYGYELLRANRNIHSVGIYWSPIWGSDMEGYRMLILMVIPDSRRRGSILQALRLSISTVCKDGKCLAIFIRQ